MGFPTVLSVLLTSSLVIAATVTPPAYPLAVRNPSLHSWLPGAQAKNIAQQQAVFWNGNTLTWQILARVNDVTYALFGFPSLPSGVQAASTVSANYTSTHSYFNLEAAGGEVSFILDFFSPVNPTNNIDQSMPFSFFTVSVSSSSNADVQIFTGIDDTWLAGSGIGARAARQARQEAYQLTYESAQDASYLSFTNGSAIPFTESKNMATWGSIQLGVAGASSQTSASSGVASQLQQHFVSKGNLDNSVSKNFLPTSLVALSYDLGRVSSSSVTFAIGNFRSESLQYTAQTETTLSAFFTATYPTVDAAFKYFLSSYARLHSASLALDAQVRQAASMVSSNLADMVEASVRQAYSASELVIDSRNPDLNNPIAILKEISSNGDANSVDVIMPSMPAWLYLSPKWIKYHLQPYVTYIESGRWTKDFIPHDLGKFPRATKPGSENMPLQNIAAWMHMLYAYNEATNGADLTWIQSQKSFLAPIAANLLTIANATTLQLSTTDWAGSHRNQTSLAVQGAQALVAYGKLFNEPSFVSAGLALGKQLYEGGLGMNAQRTHFTYLFGGLSSDDSYNVQGAGLFLDRCLGLSTINPSAWALEEEFYSTQVTPLGLPYIGGFRSMGDGCNPHGGNLAITEWNMWATAGLTNTTLQEQLIDGTYAFFTNKQNQVPFPTRYCTKGQNEGVWQLCRARSAVGSLFAPVLAAGAQSRDGAGIARACQANFGRWQG